MTLAEARTAIAEALATADDNVTVYRRQQRNYDFPALVVGWPQSMDVRPSMGDQRDFVIDVTVGVEVLDDDSADETLEELIEATFAPLLEQGGWDIQPATDFGESVTADQRTVLWCRIPVAIFS